MINRTVNVALCVPFQVKTNEQNTVSSQIAALGNAGGAVSGADI